MKLNKMKISRLTNAQAKAVMGGYGSTRHDFTCGWCTSATYDNAYTCKNTDFNEVNTCYQCPTG